MYGLRLSSPAARRLAACLLGSALLISSQTPGFKIAGQVVRQTSAAVKGARVSIFVAQSADRQLSCVTGENGEFAFSGLPRGKYLLQVNYHGWSQTYQQLDEYSTAIAVGPGRDSEHIVFPLDSPASIAGSVIDDAGDPVRNATVYLFGQSFYRGIPQTGLKSTASTATDGSFHFANLAPGTYYVAVTGRPWYAQTPQLPAVSGEQQVVDPELDVAYPTTYYGGATTPEAATPLKLEAGGRAEIQFNLRPVPALHISLDGIEKQPDQQIFGSLSQIGPGGALLSVQAVFTNSALAGVAPGNYLLSTSLPGEKQSAAIGSQAVSLASDSTVHLSEAVKTSVSGKVVLSGEIPQGLAVFLENAADRSQTAFAFVNQDGSFAMPDVRPARYDLRLANTPELYLKSVAAKGGAYSNGQLDVSSGAQIELTIHAERGLNKVDGMAVRGNKPVSGAMVLLLPLDFSHGNYIPRDQSDSDGTFTLNWAAPGRYTLVAIDNGRGLEYANPAVMAPYLQAGRVVDVPLPKDAAIEVEVQPRK
ncbi:MAG: carboxypeptidase-like regulatory domain-containing protein [Bryobacteraceae bacterium]